jgi:putative transposase
VAVLPARVRRPRDNSYAERVIGTIRRECLNHMTILGRRHLRKILSDYLDYYHSARTHLSLGKDTPDCRATQQPEQGEVVELRRVGGLHHEYVRMAAYIDGVD